VDQADDEGDFRAFVVARWPALVGTAYLITTDRGIAEDCVQEALTAVHRRWPKVRDGNPAAYAHRAVVNASLSWRRRRRIREVPLLAGVEPGRRSAYDELGPLGVEAFDGRLLAALRSLPPRMRAAVTLRYLEDRSEAETAQLLGISLGALKSTTSRGIAKLRAALDLSEPVAVDGDALPAARSTEGGSRR